jgi:hypothetical protein
MLESQSGKRHNRAWQLPYQVSDVPDQRHIITPHKHHMLGACVLVNTDAD